MPANATKAQRAQGYKDRGVMDPRGPMTDDELQRHLGRRPVKFDHRNTKRLRTRGAQQSRAINDQR